MYSWPLPVIQPKAIMNETEIHWSGQMVCSLTTPNARQHTIHRLIETVTFNLLNLKHHPIYSQSSSSSSEMLISSSVGKSLEPSSFSSFSSSVNPYSGISGAAPSSTLSLNVSVTSTSR